MIEEIRLIKAKPLPSLAYLEECFECYPDIGVLVWKERPISHFKTEAAMRWTNTRFAGKEAHSECNGYRKVRIAGQHYLTHRIVWKMVTGEDPTLYLDHENTIPSDFSFGNLREATPYENSWNQAIRKNNTSGYKGVTYYKQFGRYSARIMRRGKSHHLGLFDTPEEAYSAYCEAAETLHGKFKNVNVWR